MNRRIAPLLAWLLAGLAVTLMVLVVPLAGTARGEPPALTVFVRRGCPHCDHAKAFLPELQRRHPELQARLRWVDDDGQARRELVELSRRAGVRVPGVPSFAIGDELLVGFDSPAGRGQDLLAMVERRSRVAGEVRAGPLGTLSASRMGLPLFSLSLGLLDGFNPCAMWVLLVLLSLLLHWRDRRRMALVAGTFVLVSGVVYFLFMAAWLNAFLVLGMSTPLHPRHSGIGQTWCLRPHARRDPEPLSAGSAGGGGRAGGAGEPGGTALHRRSAGSLHRRAQSAGSQGSGPLRPSGALHPWLRRDDALMVGLAVWALSSERLSERGARILKGMSGAVMVLLALMLLLRPGWLF